MKQFFGNKILAISVLLLLTTSTAFSYKKVKSFVLKPPEQMLPGVKRIAVLDFSSSGSSEATKNNKVDTAEELGYQILSEIFKNPKKEAKTKRINYGRNFTDYLIAELIKDKRGIHRITTGFLGFGSGREGKTLQDGTFSNIYEVLERSQLEQVIQEQQLSASGLVDENQVIELGNILGVQALLAGDVSFFHKDKDYTEKRTVKKDGKNVTKKVNCQRREVKVTVRVKIISAETGKILGSTQANKSISKSTCEDRSGTLPTIDEMIDEGLKKLTPRIANYMAPHYVMESYELEKIKAKNLKKPAEKAAKLAENLKIDDAYVIYKSIYEKDSYNPEALYNIGIMHEVTGNFRQANEFYNSALELKDEGKYKDALKRVEKSVAFAEALAKIGIIIKEHSFEISQADMKNALAKKVKTQGKREDRIPAYAKPDENSEVVARIPGDLMFTVLARKGNWYLLKLMGGKQGYVHKDKIK